MKTVVSIFLPNSFQKSMFKFTQGELGQISVLCESIPWALMFVSIRSLKLLGVLVAKYRNQVWTPVCFLDLGLELLLK